MRLPWSCVAVTIPCANTLTSAIEGAWALPHGEFGLDLIALIGTWRFAEHRSVLEIHQCLQSRHVQIAGRTVTLLVHRYEELVTLHPTKQQRMEELLTSQGSVILAIDGLRPDVGHEVHWVIRDCLSGEICPLSMPTKEYRIPPHA